MSTVALENKTILVTGAAGFIGSNLVKRICEGVPSAKVVGIDSVNDYYDVALKEFRLNELSKYESFTFIMAFECSTWNICSFNYAISLYGTVWKIHYIPKMRQFFF